MNLFFSLNEESLKVIGLYPDLLPSSFHNKFEYPIENPSSSLSLQSYSAALASLAIYLKKVRSSTTLTFSSPSSSSFSSSPKTDFNEITDSQTIIDTVLLKIDLKLGQDILPLLSSPNKCHLQTIESLLLNSNVPFSFFPFFPLYFFLFLFIFIFIYFYFYF